MSDIIYTRLNNKVFSAASCTCRIALAEYVGLVALNFEQGRERKLVHGMRRDGTPIGKTGGKYSVKNCSFTMGLGSYQILIDALSLIGFGSYGDAEFPILATFHEPLSAAPPIVIAIEKCSIVNEKDTVQEGIEEQLVEVDILAETLTRNGRRMWSVAKGLGQ